VKRICLLILALSFLGWLISMTCLAAPAPNPSEADEDEPYQILTQNEWTCEGDICSTESGVTIIKGHQTLTAQRATFNKATEIAEVSGNVRLESEGDILTAENGIFNLKTKTGNIVNGHLFLKKNNYHITGDTFEKTGENTYIIRDCRVTTCEGEKPAWSITGSEVHVTIEGYGTIKNAAFRIRDFPVLYVPYFIFPAKTKRQTGLLPPSVGHSDLTGMEIELPFFWAISDQTDATFYEHWLQERGLMQGLEFRYVAEDDSKGLLLLDYLHDRLATKDMNDPDQLNLSPYTRTNTNRYWLRSRVDQQLSSDIQARLDLDLVSDQDYLREFDTNMENTARTDLTDWIARPLEETHSPTRRSALRLSLDGQEYSLQTLASYYQRPENPAHDTTPQPLGSLYYSLLPRPIADLPLFFALDTEYNDIYREEGVAGHRLELAPKLSYPMLLGPYLEFEPSLRLINTMQWVDDDETITTGHQSKSAYHFQALLATSFERQYDLSGKNLTKLRHKITPTLTYDFRGYQDQNLAQPWFEAVDSEGSVNRLTFALKNFLDGRYESKKGQVSYRQWATLEFSQAYNFLEARRNEQPSRPLRPFEPLNGTLTITPYPNLDFSANARWDHYKRQVIYNNLTLALSQNRAGGKKDSLSFDYVFNKDGNQTFNYALKLNLVSGLSAGTSSKRDLVLHDTLENAYWLDYMLQCWGIRLTYTEMDNDQSFMLMFHLKGLGDIGSQ
jgi:LPS-assembly protein